MMQSFGDDTLLACLNVEVKHRGTSRDGEVSRERNISDLGKYFKHSLPLSEFMNGPNDTSKLSNRANTEVAGARRDGSDFEDSIIFPKVKNLKHSSDTSREDETTVSRRKNRSGAKKSRNVSAINSRGKRDPSDADNVATNSDEPDARRLRKNRYNNNKSREDAQDAIGVNGGATISSFSSAISATYDKENSDIIASPPLGTQDRCKLASWGLPSNILQVYLDYDAKHLTKHF